MIICILSLFFINIFAQSFGINLLAYLIPKSSIISSLPPGIAIPLTSLYNLSTFPPYPPLVYPKPPNI